MTEAVKNTLESLKKNNMEAYFCSSKDEALELVKKLIKKGDTVSNGGSVTLAETGVMDLLKSGDYNYLDRARPGITQEEIEQVYRSTYSADAYFASANAVTQSGYIYNVDGNSNRVSAILYGPKSVILLVGTNKIVKTIDDAVERVKKIAAPNNARRLNLDTYCSHTDSCVSLNKNGSEICDGCASTTRICCNYVLSGYQRHKNRIKVIIIDGSYGY